MRATHTKILFTLAFAITMLACITFMVLSAALGWGGGGGGGARSKKVTYCEKSAMQTLNITFTNATLAQRMEPTNAISSLAFRRKGAAVVLLLAFFLTPLCMIVMYGDKMYKRPTMIVYLLLQIVHPWMLLFYMFLLNVSKLCRDKITMRFKISIGVNATVVFIVIAFIYDSSETFQGAVQGVLLVLVVITGIAVLATVYRKHKFRRIHFMLAVMFLAVGVFFAVSDKTLCTHVLWHLTGAVARLMYTLYLFGKPTQCCSRKRVNI